MDSVIAAAARALAAGDLLGALNLVALRDDAPALALRGIAMAQLGDLVRARELLRCAARAFGPNEAVARARCIVAEAEIALASRDLGWTAKTLDSARATLEAHGDRVNAAHARYLQVRRLLLMGRLDEAERVLADLDPTPFPPASRAAHQLVVAGIAMRRLQTGDGPRRARPGRAGRAPGRHPCARRGSRKRIARLADPRCAPNCRRRRASSPARGSRSFAGVGGIRGGCLPQRRASGRHGHLAGDASGVVRAGTNARRSVARRRAAAPAPRPGIRSETRRRIPSRALASRDRAASPVAANAGRDSRHGSWVCAVATPRARGGGAGAARRRRACRSARPSWPTVNPGQVPRWHWHWAPASAPYSGRSTRLRQRARCSGSAARGLAAG